MTAIATEAHSRTRTADMWMRMGDTADAAQQQAKRKSQRKNVQRARLGNALRDQMAGEPVPHPDFAGDVEKQEEARAETAAAGRGWVPPG